MTIEEIKDKVTTLSKEVEQFQGEVLYKEKVLAKMRADHEIAVKGRGVLRDDITKCTQVVKAKKVRGHSLTLDISFHLNFHVRYEKIDVCDFQVPSANHLYTTFTSSGPSLKCTQNCFQRGSNGRAFFITRIV